MKQLLLLTAMLLSMPLLAQKPVAPMLEPASFDGQANRNVAKASSAATTDINFKVKYLQTDCRSMLSRVNALRTGSDAWYWNSDNTTKTVCTGLGTLAFDAELEKIAMQRAAEQVVYYSHTRPDGRNCWTPYAEYNVSASYYGENIAAGYVDEEEAYVGWEEKDDLYSGQGHRRNMLNSNFNAIGIAGAEYGGIRVWVQCLAKKTVKSNLPTANDAETEVAVSISTSNITEVYNINPTEKVRPFTTISTNSVSTTLATNDQMDSRVNADFNTTGWVSGVLKNYYPWWSTVPYISATINPTWTVSSPSVSLSDNLITRTNQVATTLTAPVLGKNYSITITPLAEPKTKVTLNAKGLATYSFFDNVNMAMKVKSSTSGTAKGYTAVVDDINNPTTITCTELPADNGIHFSESMIIMGAPGDEVELEPSTAYSSQTSLDACGTTNSLLSTSYMNYYGKTPNSFAGKYFYALSGNQFLQYVQTDGTTNMDSFAGSKGVFILNAKSDIANEAALRIMFENANGIANVQNNINTNDIFDLNGRVKNTRQGMYIEGGKIHFAK